MHTDPYFPASFQLQRRLKKSDFTHTTKLPTTPSLPTQNSEAPDLLTDPIRVQSGRRILILIDQSVGIPALLGQGSVSFLASVKPFQNCSVGHERNTSDRAATSDYAGAIKHVSYGYQWRVRLMPFSAYHYKLDTKRTDLIKRLAISACCFLVKFAASLN